MDISDVIFNYNTPSSVKRAIFEMIMDEDITDPCMPILTPTDANDDVNGSQHARNGGNDFTYRDATESDISDATTLGYYDYFGTIYSGYYTGHAYQGSDHKFGAIVIDPPAYAVSVTI